MKTSLVTLDIWRHIQSLYGKSPRTVVVAYLSHEVQPLEEGDLVITDASREAIASGQTSAKVLLKAAQRGAMVYSLPKLHAKIIIAGSTALVSSANHSATSQTLHEAGVLTSDPTLVRNLRKYVEHLRQLAKRPLSLSDLNRLAAIPVIYTRFAGAGHRGARPSLLEALRSNAQALDGLVFSWYTWEDVELSDAEVGREAKRRGIPLPEGGAWDWYQSNYVPGALGKFRKAYGSTPIVTWPMGIDKAGVPTRFYAHLTSAAPLVDVMHIRQLVVSITATRPAQTGFNLSKDRSELARILTRGLQHRAAQTLRLSLKEDPTSAISLTQLRRLYELGSSV